MAPKAAGLAAAKVEKAGPGRYGDGNGLYLLVKPNGGRYWIFRFTRQGHMREMGLGPAGRGGVSLAEARDKAVELKRLLREGVDPLTQRAAHQAEAKAQAQVEVLKRLTFRDAAARYIASHEAGWRNAKHHAQWRATLDTYAYPHFGDVPVGEVGVAHVLAALEPIWRTKPETAGRVRGRIEAVLDYARAREWRAGENPAAWKGRLALTLPLRSKIAAVEHHAALPWSQIGDFMAKLRSRPGVAARALEFAILTAGRTKEVLGATWGEIDLDAGLWTIEGSRMKAGAMHRVPLSAAALAVLDDMAKLRTKTEPTAPVFPGGEPGKPLSGMAMLMTLRRMGRDDITTHGFRSTFRDWCAEATPYPRELAEKALAHTLADETERAYQRGDLLKRRAEMMSAWAAFCVQPMPAKGDNVVRLRTDAAA